MSIWFNSLLFSLLLLFRYTLPFVVCDSTSLEDNEAVQRFREYLRINTMQPDPDYASAIEFLLGQAYEIGLDPTVVELVKRKPILVMTWQGSEPSLSSILLSSHMDVVNVDLEKWIYDPLGAFMDENGNIYGRGTQDMKGMAMHYLEAVRNLKKDGFNPVRTIHIVFVPDEEIGGEDGWKTFIDSDEFARLNAGITMDEGPISTNHSCLPVTWAEKSPWWLVIKSVGAAGHGSIMYDGSALENLFESIESISRFRESQFNLMATGVKDAGEVVSVNGVFLNAGTLTSSGYTMNVQPSLAEAGFDIRVPPYADVASALDRRIAEEWAPASRNMSYWFKQKFETDDGETPVTETGESNPWWVLLQRSTRKFGADVNPEIGPASTDMRFIRQKGVPAFGFTTLRDTPSLLHDNNEFVNAWIWLEGITIYEEVIREFASYPEIVNLRYPQDFKRDI